MAKITSFKIGTVVTRVEPVFLGADMDNFGNSLPRYDSSYIGERLKFIAIENGCIYFENLDAISSSFKFVKLPYYRYNDDNWKKFKGKLPLELSIIKNHN